VAHPRRRNEARPHLKRPPGEAGGGWIWGWHAVCAALGNPLRAAPHRLLATPDRTRQLARHLRAGVAIETADANAIDRALGRSVVHQGVALAIEDIAPTPLESLAQTAAGVLVMVDQVTDPQNIGAIFRSAAAFGARGVILQDRHAPQLSGALAKAAAGAIDAVPHAREVNLARALERLEQMGWRAIGLDSQAETDLEPILDGSACVIVLGSEDEGLRRLVREHCDVLARIPMSGAFESLNVGAAAAVALYAAQQALALAQRAVASGSVTAP
jgi:23S rRNA (guanosine2251-2'-O)-methyltransferase